MNLRQARPASGAQGRFTGELLATDPKPTTARGWIEHIRRRRDPTRQQVYLLDDFRRDTRQLVECIVSSDEARDAISLLGRILKEAGPSQLRNVCATRLSEIEQKFETDREVDNLIKRAFAFEL